MVGDAVTTLSADELEDRLAGRFLEELVADRFLGRKHPLSYYLSRYPRFEIRVAREYLATLFGAARPEPDQSGAADDGTRVGPFRLIRELGRGGQGVVFLAEDTRMPRNVALKLLTGAHAARAGSARLRFERELQALARLDHPGICTVYEAGEIDGTPYLAMRHVDGESLATLILRSKQTGTLPRTREEIGARVSTIVLAAQALQVAHDAGIVHRDVKPANILLDRDGSPVLVDFGLARDEASGTPTITVPGSLIGTLGYLAPERLTNPEGPGSQRGPQEDIWALGACLYELLAHERPFQAATSEAELRTILTQEAKRLGRRNPSVSRDLEIVVATALEKDLSRRYQSASDLAEDLRCVLELRPIRARPATWAYRIKRFAQRNLALTLTLCALLASLGIGLLLTLGLLSRTRAALDEVAQLADLKVVRDLREQAEALWPARKDRVNGMDEWLAKARRLQSRADLHAAALARIGTVHHDDTELAWRKEQLEELQRELSALPRTIAQVEGRREFAATVAERTLVREAARWRETIAAITDSNRYGGLVIAPQLGLIPLGRDPRSGLFEFGHLESGEPAVRDPNTGTLLIGEASGIVFVLIPGGRASIGAERPSVEHPNPVNPDPVAGRDCAPIHEIDLDPFFLGKHEITQAQWLRQTGTNPSMYGPDSTIKTKIRSRLHPVEQVSWVACERVLHRLELALPTEAQWEWAGRAGTHTPYFYGSTVDSVFGHENFPDVSAKKSFPSWEIIIGHDDGHALHAPIGSYEPNGFGLCDMAGNVNEWCADTWENYDECAPRRGDGLRLGEQVGFRVRRGGSWAGEFEYLRAASRGGFTIDAVRSSLGVRAARRIEP